MYKCELFKKKERKKRQMSISNLNNSHDKNKSHRSTNRFKTCYKANDWLI